jgi:hypothetical protein
MTSRTPSSISTSICQRGQSFQWHVNHPPTEQDRKKVVALEAKEGGIVDTIRDAPASDRAPSLNNKKLLLSLATGYKCRSLLTQQEAAQWNPPSHPPPLPPSWAGVASGFGGCAYTLSCNGIPALQYDIAT